MKWLNGKKTYIGMLLLGALGLAFSMGWIDEKTFAAICSIVGTFTGVSMRAGVQKAEDAANGKK